MLLDEIIDIIRNTARINDELPEHAVSALYALLDSKEGLKGKEPSLNLLLEQIRDYDPHAGIGCFGGGVSLSTIMKTIDSLK